MKFISKMLQQEYKYEETVNEITLFKRFLMDLL